MDRRRFLDLLTKATVGGAVAYSFPDIIVPKNLAHARALIFDSIETDEAWADKAFNGSASPISFDVLLAAYKKAQVGYTEPNYVLANKVFYSYVRSLNHS